MKGFRVNFFRKECKANFVIYVRVILSISVWFLSEQEKKLAYIIRIYNVFGEFFLTNPFSHDIIYITKCPDLNRRCKMSKSSKAKLLNQKGCLNPKPQQVKDEIFEKYDFFDPCDLIQVKYEMIRKVKKEEWTVQRASKIFGFSRPSFYDAQRAFESGGIPGLIPKKRGPRHPHKLTDDVIMFLEECIEHDHKLKPTELLSLLETRFNLRVDIRSIQRSLAKVKVKKKQQKQQRQQRQQRKKT
jgi:transposase